MNKKWNYVTLQSTRVPFTSVYRLNEEGRTTGKKRTTDFLRYTNSPARRVGLSGTVLVSLVHACSRDDCWKRGHKRGMKGGKLMALACDWFYLDVLDEDEDTPHVVGINDQRIRDFHSWQIGFNRESGAIRDKFIKYGVIRNNVKMLAVTHSVCNYQFTRLFWCGQRILVLRGICRISYRVTIRDFLPMARSEADKKMIETEMHMETWQEWNMKPRNMGKARSRSASIKQEPAISGKRYEETTHGRREREENCCGVCRRSTFLTLVWSTNSYHHPEMRMQPCRTYCVIIIRGCTTRCIHVETPMNSRQARPTTGTHMYLRSCRAFERYRVNNTWPYVLSYD